MCRADATPRLGLSFIGTAKASIPVKKEPMLEASAGRDGRNKADLWPRQRAGISAKAWW